MSYHSIFVILLASNPLFFKGLKNELRSSGNIEASDPGIQQERPMESGGEEDLGWVPRDTR
jgi:hypothetical protein